MTKQELISDIESYFENYRNTVKPSINRGGKVQFYFAFNRFLIIAGNLKFEIVIKKLEDNDIRYDLKFDKSVLKFPSKYSSYSEKTAIEGFLYLIKVYESLIEDNGFRNFLTQKLNDYQNSLPLIIKDIFQNINYGQPFSWNYNYDLHWHIYIETIRSSKDTRRVGRDTRTDSSMKINFIVFPISENYDKMKMEKLQSHLDKYIINEHDTSYGYYSANTNEDITTNKMFDLFLTKYANQLNLNNESISQQPPTEGYEQDWVREKLMRKSEEILNSLKVIIYIIFSENKILQNAGFEFYDLLSIIRYFKLNIIHDKEQHMFYETIISELSFNEIYGSNKGTIDEFLYSYISNKNLKNLLIQYYCNCHNSTQIFNVESIHHSFKDFFSLKTV